MLDWFEVAKMGYPQFYDKDTLKRWVTRERITAEQYEEITGEAYTE